MSKKGENIYKRNDGRWEGRYIQCYRENGTPKFGYVYSKSYTEVKRKLNEKKAYEKSNAVNSSRKTALYNNILSDWLQSVRLNVKPSTYVKYENLINLHIRGYLGKYHISKISTELVERFVDYLLCSGRSDGRGGLSPKTVIGILSIIKNTMDYARRHDIPVPCDLSAISVKRKDKEMRVLTVSEQDRLLSVLTTDTDLIKLGILISLYTGIRLGELCALKRSDIDLKQGVLKVRKTMQRLQDRTDELISKTAVIVTEPKTDKSIRDIPIPVFLLQIAKNFKAKPTAYVLTGVNDKYIEPRTMQNRFKSIIAECGLTDVNFHALRHTFATRCVEVGFEVKALSEILGHSSVNITLNRYVHSSFDHKIENMNKLKFGA